MKSIHTPSRLLLVDDDVNILKLLCKIFENRNWSCTVATSAKMARELMRTQEYDVLVTDIRMPGESGVDLIHYTKEKYPEMAIVIISVITDLRESRAILELGVYGFIVKPFERHQVIITVNNALIRRDLEIQAKKRQQNIELTLRQRNSELAQLVEDLSSDKSNPSDSAKYHQNQLQLVQTMLDAIPNPIFFKNTSGVYIGCNQAFEACLGIDRDQIIGNTVHDIAPVKLADHSQREDQILLKEGGKQTYEGPVAFADGSQRDVLFTRAAYRNSVGEIAGLVGVLVDITDRKQKEVALRMSEEKNRGIVENIEMGVALIDSQMELLEMNSKMTELFSDVHKTGHIICEDCFSNQPRSAPCDLCPGKKTLSDGMVHEAVIQYEMEDGTHDFKFTTSAISDSSGKIVATIVLVNDISEDLAMERELRQSQKLASIGQLAAGVAHEINNPTGFVNSNLGALKEYQNDIIDLLKQYREFKTTVANSAQGIDAQNLTDQIAQLEATEEEIDLDYIIQDTVELINESQEGTERIKKIVEDLKHFAHPGQDKFQDTDINKELESTLNVVNNELKYKAKVIKEFSELPIITANPQQLNQVFVNILVNAAQAIEKMGEIRITTRCKGESTVQIEISDTGSGIAEEHIAKIFDPFFTTKCVGKGTGLGMNIAYNIIQKHQGDIRVTSRLGEGTTFVISLPVEAPSLNEEHAAVCKNQELLMV